jgi:hypothetical protein
MELEHGELDGHKARRLGKICRHPGTSDPGRATAGCRKVLK